MPLFLFCCSHSSLASILASKILKDPRKFGSAVDSIKFCVWKVMLVLLQDDHELIRHDAALILSHVIADSLQDVKDVFVPSIHFGGVTVSFAFEYAFIGLGSRFANESTCLAYIIKIISENYDGSISLDETTTKAKVLFEEEDCNLFQERAVVCQLAALTLPLVVKRRKDQDTLDEIVRLFNENLAQFHAIIQRLNTTCIVSISEGLWVQDVYDSFTQAAFGMLSTSFAISLVNGEHHLMDVAMVDRVVNCIENVVSMSAVLDKKLLLLVKSFLCAYRTPGSAISLHDFFSCEIFSLVSSTAVALAKSLFLME